MAEICRKGSWPSHRNSILGGRKATGKDPGKGPRNTGRLVQLGHRKVRVGEAGGQGRP